MPQARIKFGVFVNFRPELSLNPNPTQKALPTYNSVHARADRSDRFYMVFHFEIDSLPSCNIFFFHRQLNSFMW